MVVRQSDDVRRLSGRGEGLRWLSGGAQGLRWWSGEATMSIGGPAESRPICTVQNIGRKIVMGTVQDDQNWSDRPGTIWRSAGPI
ncbi:hypothetical protein MA16_Dca000834 [Dendrobium catenatum]|uniref:Uncharacterized protein n=1 Tax=Dendrobium catenatum TaxID=906689 RepID=A0A2I0WUZ7_9ASPA|nr:hypothetical protein MA16_Dca000834 [Dendrobium catenatum]